MYPFEKHTYKLLHVKSIVFPITETTICLNRVDSILDWPWGPNLASGRGHPENTNSSRNLAGKGVRAPFSCTGWWPQGHHIFPTYTDQTNCITHRVQVSTPTECWVSFSKTRWGAADKRLTWHDMNFCMKSFRSEHLSVIYASSLAINVSGLSLTLVSYICMGICSWTSSKAFAPSGGMAFSLSEAFRRITFSESFTFNASDAMALKRLRQIYWCASLQNAHNDACK